MSDDPKPYTLEEAEQYTGYVDGYRLLATVRELAEAAEECFVLARELNSEQGHCNQLYEEREAARAEAAMLRGALEKAAACICGEFCTDKHCGTCAMVRAALAPAPINGSRLPT